MNRPLSLNLAICSLFCLAVHGCGSAAETQTVAEAKSLAARTTDPQIDAADSATFAANNEAFALDAYHVLANDNSNLVFSPSSISIALAMAYAGAAGTTVGEMASAMHFGLPPAQLHPAFNALDLSLEARVSFS